MTERKIRVLIAKPGLDGHDRGAEIVALAGQGEPSPSRRPLRLCGAS